MTIPATSSPHYLPISALLAPQTDPGVATSHPVPSPSAAILGPLPPTTPLHLALNWLALSDLPEYESIISAVTMGGPAAGAAVPAAEGPCAGRRKRKRPERVLVITGRKDEFYQALQDEDEDWMRDHGSDYAVLERLKRVDIRYCPSPEHLTLLLSLLSSTNSKTGSSTASESTFSLDSPPSLVILWDLASLLMEWEGADENVLPDDEMGGYMRGLDEGIEPRLRFKKGAKLSDYLDIIAASRSTIDHFSSADSSRPKPQFIILEQSLDAFSSLPVLPPSNTSTAAATDSIVPTQSRQKRVKLIDGLSWMLGSEAIGVVSPFDTIAEDIHAPHYQLDFPSDPSKTCYIKRRRCGRGEWARPAFREGDTEGDHGGWRWEWC